MRRCAFLILLVVVFSVSMASFIPPSQASLKCITCVATVKGVEGKMLNEGGEIGKKDVDAICLKEVPVTSAEHLCEEYGEKEVDQIVAGIKAKIPPKLICQQLNKC